HAHDGRRILQARQRAALRHEALAPPGEILSRGGRARQYGRAVLAHGESRREVLLDGDLAVELAVVGAIGDAKAALSEDGHDLVAPDRLAGLKRDEVDRGSRSLGLTADVAHAFLTPARRLPRTLAEDNGRRAAERSPASSMVD